LIGVDIAKRRLGDAVPGDEVGRLASEGVGLLGIVGALGHGARVPSGRFLDTFYFWGKNVTAFYIIHWLLIGWGHMLLGANQLNIPQTLFAMVVILVTSHFILKGWLKISAIGKSVPAPELISDTSQVSIR